MFTGHHTPTSAKKKGSTRSIEDLCDENSDYYSADEE
jgi:hypothetical protein